MRPSLSTRIADFARDLKRRRVFRVGAWYVLGAWVLIQVAETTFPYVGLPPSAVSAVIGLTIAGLPVALVLSWVFDITPEGLETTSRSPPRETEEIEAPSDALTIERAPPTPVTPIIGRSEEIARADELLRRERVRLLTIVGAGGSGKTRLAMELARRLEESEVFPDGIAWVPLDTVRDPELVAPAVGRAFGFGESGDEEILTTITSTLGGRRVLLILDNFEQIVDAGPLLTEILTSCAGVSILVTSRAPLRLRGERELPLSPLPTPAPGLALEEVMEAPAVRLFAERAQAVHAPFRLTEANAAQVAALCRRLDGLPLALELVAARSKMLSPAAILERLEQRTPVLGEGARDLPAHQRTLGEAIRWSDELLKEEERTLFHRLGVFAGGFELDAVEDVTAVDSPDLLDLLEALVNQSLVLTTDRGGSEPRFEMLEVIGEYARDALASAKDHAAVRHRHARHFTELARRAEPELVGPEQTRWLQRLEEEHDNLRNALGWLEEHDPAEALELAVLLRRFWEMRGHLTEGRRRLGALLEAAPGDGKLQRKALYAAGVLADAQEDYGAARRHFETSLALHREAGDEWGVANALNNMGVVALRHGDHETAYRLYDRSASLWRRLGNDAAVALALNNLANVARRMDRHDDARRALDESLAMQRRAGDRNGCALTLGLMAELARDEGEDERAATLYGESLSLFRQTGNRPQIAHSLLELGRVQHARGRLEEARECHLQGMLEYVELGSPRGLADALNGMAALAADSGDVEERQRFHEAAQALRDGRETYDPEPTIELALRWATA